MSKHRAHIRVLHTCTLGKNQSICGFRDTRFLTHNTKLIIFTFGHRRDDFITLYLLLFSWYLARESKQKHILTQLYLTYEFTKGTDNEINTWVSHEHYMHSESKFVLRYVS